MISYQIWITQVIYNINNILHRVESYSCKYFIIINDKPQMHPHTNRINSYNIIIYLNFTEIFYRA